MLINPKAGIILPTYKGTWTRPTVSGESFCKMFEIEMDHMDSILYKLEIGRIERFRFISSPYLEHVHES